MLYWITSFDHTLYAATGMSLVGSYVSSRSEGQLYVVPEGKFFSPPLSVKAGPDLVDSELLQTYLHKYRDKIPGYLGGTGKPCTYRCKAPMGKRDKDHVDGCQNTWWNRNWSKWFRKVVSLYEFTKSNIPKPDDKIIWLDSDCIFNQKITVDFVENKIFDGCDCVYFKGRERKVEETGIVGFNGTRGFDIIAQWLSHYTSGNIFNCVRWDDCYMFRKTRLNNPNHYSFVDIAGKMGPNADVMANSIIGPYITHNKGTHGRKLGIML